MSKVLLNSMRQSLLEAIRGINIASGGTTKTALAILSDNNIEKRTQALKNKLAARQCRARVSKKSRIIQDIDYIIGDTRYPEPVDLDESVVQRGALMESEWKHHKYIRKEDGRYIYPDDVLTSPNIHDFPHKDNVLFVTGRSGSGKTSMAMQLAYQMRKKGVPVYLYHMDQYWVGNKKILDKAYEKGYPKVNTPFAAIPQILAKAKKEPNAAFIIEGVQAAYPGVKRGSRPIAVKTTGLLKSWYRGLVGRDDWKYLLGIINNTPTNGVFGKLGAVKDLITSEVRSKMRWHRMIKRLENKYRR